MNEERIPQTPPVIRPVGDEISRPRWSVMIPAYNCFGYLETALESVLVQDPGPDQMQIEVIDDCSTDGDLRALVERVGRGRVSYYQQPFNRGSLRNFQTCLNRSRGELVHLLHGDDAVLPGFYRRIDTLFNRHPKIGAAFTNHSVINRYGKEIYGRPPLMEGAGVIQDWLSKIARRQRLQPPAMVVKRQVYEHLGGFFAFHFGEDWEMWVRIAAHYPVAYAPERLALYRYHSNNITTRSFLSGQNIQDIYKAIDTIQHYLPPEKQKTYRRLARRYKSIYIAQKSHQLYNEEATPAAAIYQAREAFRMSKNPNTLYIVFKLYLKKLIRYKSLKMTIQKKLAWKNRETSKRNADRSMPGWPDPTT
ncbi:MAG: glycosyltransferase [Solitalea sp.]